MPSEHWPFCVCFHKAFIKNFFFCNKRLEEIKFYADNKILQLEKLIGHYQATYFWF